MARPYAVDCGGSWSGASMSGGRAGGRGQVRGQRQLRGQVHADHTYPAAAAAAGWPQADHDAGGGAVPARKPSRDETLIKALVRAHRWRRRIESGQAKSITDLAEQEGVTDAYICRLLPLTCLAPDIVEAILDGRQPRRLKLAEVLGNCSLGWEEQRCTDAPGRRSGLICLGQDMQSRPPGCDCGTIPRAGRRAAKSDDQMMDVTSSPAVPGGAEASVRRAQHADHRASPLDRGRRRPRPGGRAVPGPPGARPRRPLRQDVGPPAGCPGGVTASS